MAAGPGVASASPVLHRGCTWQDPSGCDAHEGMEEQMTLCQYGQRGPDDILGTPPGSRRLLMTCSSYRHMMDDHDAQRDTQNFLHCLALVNLRGSESPGSKVPYVVVSWRNSKSGVTGNIVYDPTKNNSMVTAYTSGNRGNDWGGCARGQG